LRELFIGGTSSRSTRQDSCHRRATTKHFRNTQKGRPVEGPQRGSAVERGTNRHGAAVRGSTNVPSYTGLREGSRELDRGPPAIPPWLRLRLGCSRAAGVGALSRQAEGYSFPDAITIGSRSYLDYFMMSRSAENKHLATHPGESSSRFLIGFLHANRPWSAHAVQRHVGTRIRDRPRRRRDLPRANHHAVGPRMARTVPR
jgi:hypothetical protein